MEPSLIKNNKIFNNQKKFIVTLIILAICLFIGTSYSLLTSKDETDEVITFQAGDLNLEVKTNNDTTVNLEDELPKSEEEVETPIILNLKNIGSLTICEYRLKLIPDTSDTTPASDLLSNYIRYSISKDNGVSYNESKLLSETNNQIYVGFDLKSTGTKTIYVKVWLDEAALDNEEILNKHFYGKIDAELLQRCEALATDHIKATIGETGGIIGVTNDNQKVTMDNGNIREYRYSGPEVNNYVTFNDETWRILGIFKDEAGEEHMKIVRNEFLKSEVFPITYTINETTYKIRQDKYNIGDSAYWKDISNGNYNDWTTAGLMHWLNSLGTTDGYLKILTSTAQNMIYETTYYLGNVVYTGTAVEDYKNERGSTPCSNYCYGGDVWSDNSATWTGKIALMYPSDMGFSTDSQYWNSNMFEWSSSQLNSTWLKEGHINYEWFVSPSSGNILSVADWCIDGNVYGSSGDNVLGVRPSLYLKSEVIIASGSGTSEQPYQLTY